MKYGRFYFHYVEDKETGERVLDVIPKVEDLPPNKSGNDSAGRKNLPVWLTNITKALYRDSDDARASLKEFNFLFRDPKVPVQIPEDLGKIILEHNKHTSPMSYSEKKSRDDDFVRHATGGLRQARSDRDGGKDRKENAGVKRKSDLTRSIRGNVKYESFVIAGDIPGEEYARSWYLRLYYMKETLLKAEKLFSLGKKYYTDEPKKMGGYVADLSRHLNKYIKETTFPMVKYFHLAGILSAESGVNMASIWPNLFVLTHRLEAFAAWGRLSRGEEDPDDFERLRQETEQHSHKFLMPERIDALSIMTHELAHMLWFLMSEYSFSVAMKKEGFEVKGYVPYITVLGRLGVDVFDEEAIARYNEKASALIKSNKRHMVHDLFSTGKVD